MFLVPRFFYYSSHSKFNKVQQQRLEETFYAYIISVEISVDKKFPRFLFFFIRNMMLEKILNFMLQQNFFLYCILF